MLPTAEGEPVTAILVDVAVQGSLYALLALGLTLVFGILRFGNFAHVEIATLGAFVALTLVNGLGLPVVVGAAAAVLAGGVAGILLDRLVFSRLRGASSIMLMICSFGLGLAIRELIRATWGAPPIFFDVGLQRPYEVLGVRLTPSQAATLVVTLVAVVGFHLMLTRTRLGTAMRATADNAALAEASGIDTATVIRTVWFIGSAFAALGGVLIGLQTQVHANMGLALMLPVFAAVLLGGIGNVYGAIAGALIIAGAQNIGLAIDFGAVGRAIGIAGEGSRYIPTGYKEAISFLILILVLLLRPQGLGGARAA